MESYQKEALAVGIKNIQKISPRESCVGLLAVVTDLEAMQDNCVSSDSISTQIHALNNWTCGN